MSDTCTARIRPLSNDTEIACALAGEHLEHEGTLRDYAYAGSATTVSWFEDDRRNFHGDWPGLCPADCTLPAGHRGNHAP